MRNWDFWDWCLAGLLAVTATLTVVVVGLYAVPRAPLVIPELQTALRVGRLDEMPPNTARLERWGRELILVIRSSGNELSAVAAVSPQDGCLLGWDAQVQQVLSPCSHLVYSPRGGVVAGLSDRPLATYPVDVRDGVIYVGKQR